VIQSSFYLPNRALLTDFYQVSMAYALFLEGRARNAAVFHLFFRKSPFGSAFAVAAGISDALDYVKNFKFDRDSLDYLAHLKSKSGLNLLSPEFIKYLEALTPDLTIHGIQDGEIIFAHEPILRVEGPLALCMLLETPLLTIINFQTLIATKAARIKEAARGKKVIDFGLRRAQGFDGAISATKAAYIGGIDATSNLWAARHLDIPVSGSQSHSFIMSFAHEAQAFESYARACGDSCILLCDTYDTAEGVKIAVKKLQELKTQNTKSTLGIRLDSGDLLNLSIQARATLNTAGLKDCVIVASGDLDEYEIEHLNSQGAPIDIFGIGTRLISGHGDAALGGVYKLAAIYDQGHWRDTYKISNDPQKSTLPGRQAIMRFSKNGLFVFDQIFDPSTGITRKGQQDKQLDETLLTRLLMTQGEYNDAMLEPKEARERTIKNLQCLSAELKKFDQKTGGYSVIIDQAFLDKKTKNTGHDS